jgi:fumarate hydratase class II
LACLSQVDALVDAFRSLRDALAGKDGAFDDVVKAGRTHLQDAMPIRLGRSSPRMRGRSSAACVAWSRRPTTCAIPRIGGSAVGTGVTVEPGSRAHEPVPA